MIFRRTSSALYSQHLFYKVDIVVYCEGGPSMKASQAIVAAYAPITLDSLYWQTFASRAPGKMYYFKSVGSKTALRAIAEDITLLGVTNTSVCMDADYGRLSNSNISGPRVAYTLGYSWENDVLSSQVVLEIIRMYLGNLNNQQNSEIVRKLSQLDSELGYWCERDIELLARKLPGVFDRDNPLRVIEQNMSEICLRKQHFISHMQSLGFKRGPHCSRKIRAQHARETAFGKVVAKAIYLFVKRYIRNSISCNFVDYESFMRLAIRFTNDALSAGLLTNFAAHQIAYASRFS